MPTTLKKANVKVKVDGQFQDLGLLQSDVATQLANEITERKSNDNSLEANKIPYPLNPYSKFGNPGDILTTDGNGNTKWIPKEMPRDDLVQDVINNWLYAHPEATTTIKDGSVTESKIANNSVNEDKLSNELQTKLSTFATKNDIDLYWKKVNGLEKLILDGLQENTDISNLINDAFNMDNIQIVEVPSGNYLIDSTIDIPDGKTLILQGDYNNASITPTTLSPTKNDLTLIKFGSKSHLEGGVFELGIYENIICCFLDCHNKTIERTTIKKTKINGGRETSGNHIYSQKAIYIECDYAEEETFTKYGYMVFCEFDIYIDSVGYAYHFHRITSPSSASGGVWLTENNIFGYIRHCTRYIWYDFNSNEYANNDSIIGATLQAGSLYTGEPNYPGINIWGFGIIITGKLWDFTAPHNNPAVYFESGAQTNLVTRRCNIKDYAFENNTTTTNITLVSLSRATGFRKLTVSLYSDENFNANDYISNFSNQSYRIGDVIYLHLKFKINQTIPKNSSDAPAILFTINEDAFLDDYVFPIEKAEDGTGFGKVRIKANSPHLALAATQITSSSAWVQINGTILSNRITTFTL